MLILSLTLFLIALALLGVTLWNALAWPNLGANAELSAESATGNGAAEAIRVSILIPARDEELNLAGCLDSALAQGQVVGEVLVYDDHSTDGTAAIISEYARRDGRVRLVMPENLPPGWCGKNFACARLAAAARGRWLLYLDADARLYPKAAARMTLAAEAHAATLVSCWPALDVRGFWETALMPMLNFVVFTLYPAPLSFRRADASLGLAHGACLLARRDAYEATGGHAAVADAINEDVRLAQHWRTRGERTLCFDGQDVVSVRMYRSFTEIWRGFQKNYYPAFRRAQSFWLFLALHLFVFTLPLGLLCFSFAATLVARAPGTAALVAQNAWSFAAAGLWGFAGAAACVVAMRAALALRFRQAWWSVLLHPLGECILLALGLSSWWRCRTGRGVVWKGRRYRDTAETGKAMVGNR
jgi:glycosyltransferase involved in cell wall biosynthesis